MGRLPKMSPTAARNGIANRRLRNAIFDGQCAIGYASSRIFGLRRLDLFSSEFGDPMLFATNIRSVSDPISLICFLGIPSEVVEAIVIPESIVVTALHPLRAGADEGEQNETMDPQQLQSRKPDYQITVGGMGWIQSNPFFSNATTCDTPNSSGIVPLPSTPHAAVITDTVAGESWDVAVSDRRIGHSHDVTSRKRGCVVVRADGR